MVWSPSRSTDRSLAMLAIDARRRQIHRNELDPARNTQKLSVGGTTRSYVLGVCVRPYRSGRLSAMSTLAFREWKSMVGVQMRLARMSAAATHSHCAVKIPATRTIPMGATETKAIT